MNCFSQYEGGSDFSDVHRFLSNPGLEMRDIRKPFVGVYNGSKRAIFFDALYQNPNF
jgi:hypothetical protein